jgi:hypothetical protein
MLEPGENIGLVGVYAGEVGVRLGEGCANCGLFGEYRGEALAGEGRYDEIAGAGEPGDPGIGENELYAEDNPDASEAPDGENDGPGEPGDPGTGENELYAEDNPDSSEAPDGENDGPPGVILLPSRIKKNKMNIKMQTI